MNNGRNFGMGTVYQEQWPTRARTHRSVDEAFRTLAYTCALEKPPRWSRRTRRIADGLCWLLAFVLLGVAFTAPWWLK